MRELLILLIFLGWHGVGAQETGAPAKCTTHRCSWCVENAVCVKGTFCSCPPPFIGNGYFLCWRPDQWDVCQVCDDPVITTENNENVAVSYLDETLLVDKTILASRCRIRVTEWRRRVRGKSFPWCIFVRLDLSDSYGKPKFSVVFKVFYFADSFCNIRYVIHKGSIIFGEPNTNLRMSMWRVITDKDKLVYVLYERGCQISFQIVLGRILLIKMPCCEHTIGIRPIVTKYIWLKGGFFLLAPKTPPQILPLPLPTFLPLCLRPGWTVNSVARALGLTNTRHAMSFVAMTNGIVDNVNGKNAMATALAKCSAPQLKTLLNDVDFIYSSAPFIREISGSHSGYGVILQLMRKAAKWFCEGDYDSCQFILSAIGTRASGLVRNPVKYPSLTAFVAKNCTAL
ncbi:hypothetical protein EGW08_022946 [Elysia chlorotica]|uniref:EGF-like domain-containing protein n=1 Tax=Elysia chlorotica TaxID=188477 RepID=A0A3S1B106_ELYCH|nr:hypothetical protein EGW08_022946 [Elysia chlorotica]